MLPIKFGRFSFRTLFHFHHHHHYYVRTFCASGETINDLEKERRKSENHPVEETFNGRQLNKTFNSNNLLMKRSFRAGSQPNLDGEVDVVEQSLNNVLSSQSSRLPSKFSEEFGSLAVGEDLARINDLEIEQRFSKTEPGVEEVPLAKRRRNFNAAYFGVKIANLAKKQRYKEAIDVVEVEMLKERRIRPDAFVYSQLISSCGKAGLVVEAFKYFHLMRRKGMNVPAHVYTALFNACANCPNPKFGLKNAKLLHSQMNENNVYINSVTYAAIIKAYGMCGDPVSAFQVADLAEAKGLVAGSDTYAQLLVACASDTAAGLKHAIEVWRRMIQRKQSPATFHYRLLLRVIRDCRLGPPEFANSLLQLPADNQQSRHVETKPARYSWSSSPGTALEKTMTNFNILYTDVVPLDGQVLIGDCSTPYERLQLIGGVNGLLADMGRHNCQPDIKLLSLLLDILPTIDLDSERLLLNRLQSDSIHMDTDFVNMLLKRAVERDDSGSIKEFRQVMAKRGLKPNVRTLGILALAVDTKVQAGQLLDEFKAMGILPNLVVLSTLLRNAAPKLNFQLISFVIDEMTANNIAAEAHFIKSLELILYRANKAVLRQEKNATDQQKNTLNGNPWIIELKKFRSKYDSWLQTTDYQDSVLQRRDYLHQAEKEAVEKDVFPPDVDKVAGS